MLFELVYLITKLFIMRKIPNQSFSWAKGKYYLTIKESPRNITLFRLSRQEAEYTFKRYKLEGKHIEWLGCWNGKKFEDNTVAIAS